MTKHFSREQILEGLIPAMADCLAIEPADITPESPFFSGLGGESLDLLDITFQIQKRFGIRAHLQNLLDGWEVDSNGRLSQTTVERLSADFPLIDWTSRVDAISSDDPRDLLTVGLLAEMVFHLQKPDQPESVATKANGIPTPAST